jgi:lysophospholipid acyltransferase (LPLAT)-like uncharacterized protein
MKIRHPALIRVLAFVLAWIVRLWIGTLRFRYRPLGPDVLPAERGMRQRYLYAFWHENMLLPAYQFGGMNIIVLISQHADGQLIAEVCRHLGFGTVRGSTTRGGFEAMRRLLRAGREAHLAITPDGPRGPRRHVQPGLVFVAARTGLPIIPVGFGFRKPWRMKSWDGFVLPKPGSVATCVTDEPIIVPPDSQRDVLAEYFRRVEAGMQRASEAAERWAETGQWDARRPMAGIGLLQGTRAEALSPVNGQG